MIISCNIVVIIVFDMDTFGFCGLLDLFTQAPQKPPPLRPAYRLHFNGEAISKMKQV